MAILLQPGDPVPPLVLQPLVNVADFTGRHLLIVCGDMAVELPVADCALLRITAGNDADGTTARRLGVQEGDENLMVWVDPAGRVVRSWVP